MGKADYIYLLLFGQDEELAGLARVTAQHELACEFTHPASKTAFLAITENLVEQLEQVEGIVVSVKVRGDAPHGRSINVPVG